jgi:hypothetical protein
VSENPGDKAAKITSPVPNIGRSILAKARDYLIGLIITASAAGFIAAWYAFEGVTKTYIDNRIVDAVAEDLKKAAGGKVLEKERSTLAVPILTLLALDRAYEVGELNSGHFVLTPANPTYTTVVYYPNGSAGKLILSLDGDLSRKSYLAVSFPETDAVKVYDSEVVIVLGKKIESSNSEGVVTQSIYPLRQAEFKNLRPLTFQFVGSDVDKDKQPDQPPQLNVNYTVLISPTIKDNRFQDRQR